MKTVTVFLTLIVASLATPSVPSLYAASVEDLSRNERIVTGQIIEAIENIAQQIRDAGLDPMEITFEDSYELPVPVLFAADAIIENFLFTGLSNIVVQSMNFSILQNRLTFNIVLPGFSLSIGRAKADAIVFGNNHSGYISGRLNINTIRLIGDIRVNIGIISGISIRSLSLQFSLGGIQSALNIRVFNKDYSAWVNNFLGTRIPQALNEYSREVNQLLDIVVLRIVNDALENRSRLF